MPYYYEYSGESSGDEDIPIAKDDVGFEEPISADDKVSCSVFRCWTRLSRLYSFNVGAAASGKSAGT